MTHRAPTLGSRRTGQHLAVLALFIGLSVALLYPMLGEFATWVPGAPQDNHYYLSWFAWLRHTLLEQHALSTCNPNVFYPYGHDFATSETTWANVILTLPVLLIWGEVPAYNVAVLASFALTGWNMYLLVTYLTGSWLAGVVSGAILAFSPYRLAHLGGGQLPLLGTQWLPLCLWCMERALRERRWSWGIGAGLFYALTALSSWYYAFMAGLLLPIYVLVRVRPWRFHRRGGYLWGALLGAGLTAGVMVVPAILPTLRLSGQEGMSYSLQWVDRWSASVADYLLPNPVNALWGGATTRFYAGQRYFYERILALGYAPLALAGVAIWRARRGEVSGEVWRRTSAAFLWMGGFAFVLSLGTTWHWRGVEPVHISVPAGVDRLFDRVMFNLVTRFAWNRGAYYWGYQKAGHIVLPLPALLFYLYLPFSNAMRVWSRFGLFVLFVVAALAGKGVAMLQAERRWRVVATGVGCLVLVLLEYAALPFPYGFTQVKAQPATEWLRAQPAGTVVMELPLARAMNGPPLYAATLHGQRIAYGYGTFFPAQWLAKWDTLHTFPDDGALEVLQGWGVRYILLSPAYYGPKWPQVAERIAARNDLRWVGVFREEKLYHQDRWFIATRGTELPFVADNIQVYELRGFDAPP